MLQNTVEKKIEQIQKQENDSVESAKIEKDMKDKREKEMKIYLSISLPI
jgi:hypothetical protein